jgi:hypothetical protein
MMEEKADWIKLAIGATAVVALGMLGWGVYDLMYVVKWWGAGAERIAEVKVMVGREVLVVVIGFATIAILREQARAGRRQSGLGEKQLWLGVYDKRYAVYRGVKEYLSAVLERGRPTREELIKLLVETRESEWLMGEEVERYVKEELYSKGNRLKVVGELVEKEKGSEEAYQRNVDREAELLKWHGEQGERVRNMFEKYLSVRKVLLGWTGEG